jgi:DNA invertase Pin-like site-specific DNA recombinase
MRVSTSGDRQVLDLQRDALIAAGVDERHLFEDRLTGSRGDRAGLTKALAFFKPGDCLVVWKLDRLGRSLPHLLTTVTDLKKRGVAFRSLTEQMDTTTPQGEFLFHIFGSLAQFERSLIQERVQAGLGGVSPNPRKFRRRPRGSGRKAAMVQKHNRISDILRWVPSWPNWPQRRHGSTFPKTMLGEQRPAVSKSCFGVGCDRKLSRKTLL